jgi:hypothetical protein
MAEITGSNHTFFMLACFSAPLSTTRCSASQLSAVGAKHPSGGTAVKCKAKNALSTFKMKTQLCQAAESLISPPVL